MSTNASGGIGAFGPAYRTMMQNDSHAPGSVDRVLCHNMIRLCEETSDLLYSTFSPLTVAYRQGSRPELERILSTLQPRDKSEEATLVAIVQFTRHLADRDEQDLKKMRIGGTEEAIIARGSDWCTDVARVACVLCQVAGFPSRIVYLFDVAQAYSGHAIIESYRDGMWGALDSSTGVVYRRPDGRPASVWDLMNSPALIEAHRAASGGFYSTVGQFRAAGIANYFSWERGQYDYTVSGVNDYCTSILEMSNRGWPGGLRWLHGEDGTRVR